MKTILCVSKKHWFAYVFPIIIILFGVSFILSNGWISKLIGVFISLYGVYCFLAYKNTTWTLTDEELIIESGYYLGSFYHDILIEDIYEAGYKKGIMGRILGYGMLIIKKTDGRATLIGTTKMDNIEEMVGNINALVKEKKTMPKTDFVNIPPQQGNSVVDELYKLSELKDKGLLTEEEFNKQKNKLIN